MEEFFGLFRWLFGTREKKAPPESPEEMAHRSLRSGLGSVVLTVATALLWTERDPLIGAIGGGSGEAFQIFMLLLLSALGFSLIAGAVAVIVGLRALVRNTGRENAAAAGALLGLSPLLLVNYVLLFDRCLVFAVFVGTQCE